MGRQFTKQGDKAQADKALAIFKQLEAQEVVAQSSYYSSDDRRLHFGLGKEREAALTVRWTNGLVEKIASVEANRMITIREGSGVVKSEKWK